MSLAAISGFSGIALGAFGAHYLKARLEKRAMTEVWKTGVQYHLLHAVAMLTVALHMKAQRDQGKPENGKLTTATNLWAVGSLLFSGSIYVLALGGPKFPFGPITPVGGVFLMVGWLYAGLALQ